MKVSQYWKSILAALGATVVAAESIIDDQVITDNEWVNLGIAALTAVGVYLVPNKGDGRSAGYRGDHGAPY